MTAQDGDEDVARRAAFAKDVIEGQIKLYGAFYDKAAAYTNLLLVAGYAGFFGVWSFSRQYLTQRQGMWAASLVLISLIAFVFFEVWKGVVTGIATQRRAKILFDSGDGDEPDPEVFVANLRRFELANAKDALRLSRIWPWAWGVSVLFGLAGVVVLLFGFFYRLSIE